MQDDLLMFKKYLEDAVMAAFMTLAPHQRLPEFPAGLVCRGDRHFAEFRDGWRAAGLIITPQRCVDLLAIQAMRRKFATLVSAPVADYMRAAVENDRIVQRPVVEVTDSYGRVSYGIWGYAYQPVSEAEQKELDDCKEA